MPGAPQIHIRDGIEQNPPVPGLRLMGWALVAEWTMENGEKVLTRMASPDMPLWTFRGYMHEGLYGKWGNGGLGDWDENGR